VTSVANDKKMIKTIKEQFYGFCFYNGRQQRNSVNRQEFNVYIFI
jgi:hypothetical protein